MNGAAVGVPGLRARGVHAVTGLRVHVRGVATMPEMTGAIQRLRCDRAGLRRRKDCGGTVYRVLAKMRNAPFGASGQRCYRWRGRRIFSCRWDVVKAFPAVRGPEGGRVIGWEMCVGQGVWW